ncbi:MAG: cyclic nucleotide-binding domain-containing protein [Chitinivibrionales bacterium]
MRPLVKNYKKGAHLFCENDFSPELYIVQSGAVSVYRWPGSKEIGLAHLTKGAVWLHGSVIRTYAVVSGKRRFYERRDELDLSGRQSGSPGDAPMLEMDPKRLQRLATFHKCRNPISIM